jgi:Rrf2 family protein
MSLVPRKGLLSIAAVIDVALNAHGRPVSAKHLAARHGLDPRHLEAELQALVRKGILRGVRGPRGGYELARATRTITVEEIVRAASTVDGGSTRRPEESHLVSQLVVPAVSAAEQAFSQALGKLKIEDLVRQARAIADAADPSPKN